VQQGIAKTLTCTDTYRKVARKTRGRKTGKRSGKKAAKEETSNNKYVYLHHKKPAPKGCLESWLEDGSADLIRHPEKSKIPSVKMPPRMTKRQRKRAEKKAQEKRDIRANNYLERQAVFQNAHSRLAEASHMTEEAVRTDEYGQYRSVIHQNRTKQEEFSVTGVEEYVKELPPYVLEARSDTVNCMIRDSVELKVKEGTTTFAVHLMDRYMHHMAKQGKALSAHHYLPIGYTCLLIASKMASTIREEQVPIAKLVKCAANLTYTPGRSSLPMWRCHILLPTLYIRQCVSLFFSLSK